MTKGKVFMLTAFAVAPLVAIGALTGSGVRSVKADAVETEYTARQNFQLSNARFANLGTTGIDWEPAWQYDTVPDLTSDTATYGRLVIAAPSEGDYSIGYDIAGGDFYVGMYINGNKQIDKMFPGDNWAPGRYDIPVHLLSGNNVLIFQINNWCAISKFYLPTGLTLVAHDESDGVYYAADSILQSTNLLASTKTIHDADAVIITKPLAYNASLDWASVASFTVTPTATTKSLDLSYYVTAYSANPGVNISVNGGTTTFVPFGTGSTNVALTKNIDTQVLSDLGFDFTKPNTISITSDQTNDKEIGLISLALSTKETQVVHFTTLSTDDIKADVLLQGRMPTLSGAIPFDWSGSSMEFIATGGGDIRADMTAASACRFAVEIDGVNSEVSVPSGVSVVSLATGLSADAHRIRVIKCTEAAGGIVALNDLQVTTGMTLAKPSESPKYKFEFYGDSTCCGNQIDANGTEDAYSAFPQILSDAFKAQYNSVCVSGRGLYAGYNSENNWAASHDNELNTLYKQADHFRDPSVAWDFSSYVPDVLVVDLGNNDLGPSLMATLNYTITDFTTEVKRWHAEVRAQYPSTEIVYLYGMYANRNYEEQYAAAIADLKTGGDSHVGFVYTPQYNGGLTEHPSRAEHQLIAGYLSQYLAAKLNVTNPLATPTENYRFEAEDATILGKAAMKETTTTWENWSHFKYVGDTEPSSVIADASGILEDGSAVSILSTNVTVLKNAVYSFRLGYSSSCATQIVYVRADGGAWQPLTLISTGGWASVSRSDVVSLKLMAGFHKIDFTGSTQNDSSNVKCWANYDYFELAYQADLAIVNVSFPTAESYSITGLTTVMEKGSDVSFTLTLNANFSKSALVVKANGVAVAPVSSDTNARTYAFVVKDVESDLAITVEGVSKNVWTATFKDGDAVLSTQSLEVGAALTAPTNPTKDGYVFKGWDKTVPSSMPNGDITFNAVWEKVTTPEGNPQNSNLGLILGISIPCGLAVIAGALVLTVFLVRRHKKHVI